MTNHTTEGDFDSIIESDAIESSSDNQDALEVLTSRIVLATDGDEDLEGLETTLNTLIEKGKEQGYLTLDSLSEALPDSIIGSEEFDTIVQALNDINIVVLEVAPKDDNSKIEVPSEDTISEEALVTTLETGG